MIKKRHVIAAVALALCAPILASCGNGGTDNNQSIVDSETVKNKATINLTFNEEGGTVNYAQGTYKVGDIIHLKIATNKGYSIANVTVNGEAIRPDRGNYKFEIRSEIVNICVVFEKIQVIMSDFKFELDEKNLTAKIVEYKPDRSIIPYPFVVPETVELNGKNYVIDGIKNKAFLSSSIEAIKLSKNIKDIELETFANVHGLSSILVDQNNLYFSSYDDCLYSKDFSRLIAVPCEYLKDEITVKNGCNTIEQSAFNNSRLIQKVVLPDSVTTLKDQAFMAMRSLTDIKLSKNIKVIPSKCFANDVALRSVILPEGVEILKEYSFNFCPALESVTFPTTLKEIGKESFYHCQRLGDVILNEGLKVIGKSAFGGVLNLHSITMPSTLKRLEDAAFETCANLKTVKLNEGLEYLGGAVFILTPYIKEVVIPSTVTTINYNPFIGTGEGILKLAEGNKNYKMVDGVLFDKDLTTLICYPYNLQPENLEYRVPDSVTKLGYNCFSMNIYLKKVILPKTITQMLCAFQEILPSAATMTYEMELFYEGTKAEFKNIDNGGVIWNYKANFKNNILTCSDGFIYLSPQMGN